MVAGVLAALMRMQLAFPNGKLVPPDVFNRLFTVHGTTMVFLVGMPFFAGLANYLVPLMIGARDMAFPRLMLSAIGCFFSADSCFTSAISPAKAWQATVRRPTSAGLPMLL